MGVFGHDPTSFAGKGVARREEEEGEGKIRDAEPKIGPFSSEWRDCRSGKLYHAEINEKSG